MSTTVRREVLLVAIAFAAMAAWSWGTWPDPLIDFGRELYVPWRLSQGALLYADVAYEYGPLSPYWNALWFRLLGPGVWTLVGLNAALLALGLALVHHLLRTLAGRWSACAGCLILVAVFAFGQMVGIGNYNFLCPYSHPLTHGLLIALGALSALSAYLRHGGRNALIACGLLTGLLAETKPEMMLAGISAISLGVALRSSLRQVALFLLCLPVPLIATFVLFRLHGDTAFALKAALGAVALIGKTGPATSRFVAAGMGLDDPTASLARMGRWALAYLAVFAPAIAASFALGRPHPRRRWIAAGLCAAALLAAFLGVGRDRWLDAWSPLPLVLLVALAILLARARANALAIASLTFALLLLTKMMANTRIHHYGFALALPGTLALVAALTDGVPAWISRRGGYGPAFRAVALALLAAVTARCLAIEGEWFARKREPVGAGRDAFRADGRGPAIRDMLQEIDRRVSADQSLTVLPEGVMLNYLARRRVAGMYYLFTPPALEMFGEERVLESLRRDPPDFCVWVDRDASEYGYRGFGVDYGIALAAWVRSHYRYSGAPIHPEYPLVLLRRNDRP